MANNTLKTKIVLRNDLAANRATSEIVLATGEVFIEYVEVPAVMDTDGVTELKPARTDKILYVGDGTTALKDLKPSTKTPEQIEELLSNAVPVLSAENVEAVTHVDDVSGETVVDEAQYAKIKIEGTDGTNSDEIFVKGANGIGVGATADGITISAKELEDKVTKLIADLGDVEDLEGFDSDVADAVSALNALKEAIDTADKAGKVTISEEIGGADDDFSKKVTFYQGQVLVADTNGVNPGEEGYIETWGVTDAQKLSVLNLPKDLFLEDSEIVVFTAEQVEALVEGDAAYGQVTEAGTYIKFVIANDESKELYLSVKELANDYKVAAANDEASGDYAGEIKVAIGDDHAISVEVDQIETKKLVDAVDGTVLVLDGGSATE